MPTRELQESFNFRVTVDGFPETIEFARCSALALTVSTLEYREAGANLAIKDPNFVSYGDVTLERAASSSSHMYKWVLAVLDVLDGVGGGVAPPQDFRRHVAITQYNRAKQRLRTYVLLGAFPTAYTAGAWDNAQDALVIQSLTLTYDQFVVKNFQDPTTNPPSIRA